MEINLKIKKTTMKFTATILILLCAATMSYGQPKPIKDTIPSSKLTDTTIFLSLQSLSKHAEPLKEKYSAKAYENFMAIMQEIISASIREYEAKQKQLPTKTK
jgi:hypothetical protein